jgi:hypothetical protein
MDCHLIINRNLTKEQWKISLVLALWIGARALELDMDLAWRCRPRLVHWNLIRTWHGDVYLARRCGYHTGDWRCVLELVLIKT